MAPFNRSAKRKRLYATGVDHPNFKGGRFESGGRVWARDYGRRKRDNDFVYRPESVLIAEKRLGRPLPKGAVVHHIDGDPLNNRPGNLLICTQAYHRYLHGEMSRRYAQEHLRLNAGG